MNAILKQDLKGSEGILKHVHGLAFNRAAGSIGETEAVLYIHDELSKEGIKPKIQYFTYMGIRRVLMRIAYLITFTYLILFKLIIIIALYFSIKYLSEKARNFSLVRKESSKNLVLEIPARNEIPKKPVAIITAHYDTFSANIPYKIQTVLFFVFRVIIIPYFVVTITLSVWILYDIYFNPSRYPYITNLVVITTLIEFVIIFIIFLMIYNTNKSKGSIDNASGVAILIELSKRLYFNPLKNMDVIIVFTGSEEWGLMGAKKFCKRYRDRLLKNYDLDNSFNINLDMIGTYIGLIEKKKVFGKDKHNYNLNKKIEKAARELNVKYVKHSSILNPKTDHKIFRSFARKTRSKFQVACFHSKKDSKYIHSLRDTPEKCNPENLQSVLNICERVIRKIDSDIFRVKRNQIISVA